jgi:hypothetical protein
MASSNGPLRIYPLELKFRFEVRKQSPSSLQLCNPTDAPIAFKVKTTSPKKYCVRPNTGVVAPGQTQEVTVIMQAQKEAPPDLQNCKDKFLVQCCQLDRNQPPEEAAPEKMAEVFASKGAGVFETKLKVSYLVPHAPPSPVPEDTVGEMGEAPSYSSSYSPPTATPAGPKDKKLRDVLESLKAAEGERDDTRRAVERLTMERASLATKCETIELAAARAAPPSGATSTATQVKKAVGYNLIHLLLIAIIFFILGRQV